MKMKKLLVVSMVVAMAGVASAARNFIVNGSFEAPFVSLNGGGVTNGIYNGDPGNFAYGAVEGVARTPSFVPGWDFEATWGYVWNPTGSGGTNHWGDPVGLTTVSHGAGAYGSYGGLGLDFRTTQLTNMRAEEGDTVIFTWDINFLSADYSGGWFNGALQFVGATPPDDQIEKDFPHTAHAEPQDVWLTHSITQVVTAAQAGKSIQVQLYGAGVWVDDVRLEVFPLNQPENELLYNGGFELPFSDGYGLVYDGSPNSKAYVAQAGDTIHLPGWSGADHWGYVWNPTGTGGINNWWGTDEGLTTVSEGNGAAGSNGSVGHALNIWQNTQTRVVGGDTVIMAWDMNFPSADHGSSASLTALLQFVSWAENGSNTTTQVETYFPSNNVPFDVWRTHSITQVVTAAQSGSILQLHFQGVGAWIDNVSLKLFETGGYEGWVDSYNLTGTDAERGTDYELDGMDNLLEFSLGGNPTNDDAAAILPTSEFTTGTIEYVYNRRSDAVHHGLVYGLVLNTNGLVVGPWDPVGTDYETTNVVIDAEFESVTNTIPVSGEQGFVNLEVTEN